MAGEIGTAHWMACPYCENWDENDGCLGGSHEEWEAAIKYDIHTEEFICGLFSGDNDE
jgi:sarcosine oxidase delta subunit